MTKPIDTLEDVRGKRVKLAAEKKARDEARDLAAELAALAIDEKAAELEAKHPTATVIKTPIGAIAVVGPSAKEYRRWYDASDVDYAKSLSFIRPCIAYPPALEFEAMVDQLPGLLRILVATVLRLAGREQTEVDAK